MFDYVWQITNGIVFISLFVFILRWLLKKNIKTS